MKALICTVLILRILHVMNTEQHNPRIALLRAELCGGGHVLSEVTSAVAGY